MIIRHHGVYYLPSSFDRRDVTWWRTRKELSIIHLHYGRRFLYSNFKKIVTGFEDLWTMWLRGSILLFCCASCGAAPGPFQCGDYWRVSEIVTFGEFYKAELFEWLPLCLTKQQGFTLMFNSCTRDHWRRCYGKLEDQWRRHKQEALPRVAHIPLTTNITS